MDRFFFYEDTHSEPPTASAFSLSQVTMVNWGDGGGDDASALVWLSGERVQILLRGEAADRLWEEMKG